MRKTMTLILLNVILATNFLSAHRTDKETVYFDYDKYELTEISKEKLNKSFEKINDNELVRVTLIGHTDGDGSDKYNQTLSQNRAKAVLNYLVTKGIPSDKIKMEFYGENKPIAQNDNEQGKQQNRRVEILIEKKELVISDIFTKFNQETQNFKVSANEDITIKGKEGTIINIPKNSLCKQNGEIIKGEVSIELKEFYKKSDIISSNLHTMSDSKILETAGMIYISANFLSEKLKMKTGSEMEIEFASTERNDDMGIFIGEQQSNQINWKQQSITDNVVTIGEGGELYQGYDTVVTRKLSKIDKMILNTGDLGWINCDRFYKFENKTNLIVEMDTAYKPIVRLVFKDINVVMPSYYSKEKK